MATNKQIGVSLAFMADTSQARTQIQSLQNQLNELSKNTSMNSVLGNEDVLKKSISDVTKLSSILKNATTNAGTLDLTKFRNSLNSANLDAKKISESLGSLGPAGVQAFNQLSQAVLTAEVPIKRVNSTIQNFMDGLKRTAGWQIQSTMIHKFTGAIQQAYGYAQDLNESLTNIRIVTGKSSEEIAKFAKDANKAAKELNTTTTTYTDAALIFYQQGLEGDAVKERTDTVIKMANVTGQSAEEVSSYMTAIWNNFDNGSESLEHYADVITALGAATASSSEEIAEGLEKFAAIGSTVGLSYEYATSALATVVAQTRQSADTVGTAFKTLFARIQDLEVGKTLDDGTTLGKYSQALESIGVNIKDATGQVKDMDVILDEMGNKWKTIDKNTQIAVAQAVAGTRQYAQLVALMDNYDAFKSNVNIANNSEGALQEQADIYAESWEAARKRVRASLEDLYDNLIEDDFFIDLNNNIADLIDNISKVVDAIGGFKTLLPMIGTIFMKYFGKSMSIGITNFKQGLIDAAAEIPKIGKKFENKTSTAKNDKVRQDFINERTNIQSDGTLQGDAAVSSLERQSKVQQAVIDRQRELAKAGIELTDVEKGEVQEKLKLIDTLNKEAEASAKVLSKTKVNKFNNFNYSSGGSRKERTANVKNAIKNKAYATDLKDRFNSNSVSKSSGEQFEKYQKSMQKYLQKIEEITGEDLNNLKDIIKAAKDGEELINNLNDEITTQDKNIKDNTNLSQKSDIEEITEEYNNYSAAVGDAAFADTKVDEATEQVIEDMSNMHGETMTVTDGFVKATEGLMSLAMAINAVQGLGDIWNDEDASIGEKVLQTIMTLGMVLPGVSSAIAAFKAIKEAATLATKADTIVTEMDTIAKIKNAIATALAAVHVGVLIAAITALVAVVAVVAIAYKSWAKSLQNTADASKESADVHKQYTETLQEERNQVKSLVDSYDELYNKYKQGEISGEAMRKQAYDLCMQYERADLAVKALTGSYDDLQKAMSELDQTSAEELKDSANADVSNYKVAIRDQFEASAKSHIDMRGNSKTIDLKGMVSRNSDENKFAKELKDLGVDFKDKDHIDLQSFVEALEKDSAKVQSVLNKYNVDAAKQLRGYMEDASDAITSLNESIETRSTASLDAIGAKYGSTMITSLKQYDTTINKMVQEAMALDPSLTEKEAKQWANTYMSAIDSVREYAEDYSVKQNILDSFKFDIDTEEIDNKLENINKDSVMQWMKDTGAITDDNTIVETDKDDPRIKATYYGNLLYDANGESLLIDEDEVFANYKDLYEEYLNEQKEATLKNARELNNILNKELDNMTKGKKAFFSQYADIMAKTVKIDDKTAEEAYEEIEEKYSNAIKGYEARFQNESISNTLVNMTKDQRGIAATEFEDLKNAGIDSEEINNLYFQDASSQMTSLLSLYVENGDKLQAYWSDMQKAARDKADAYKETNSEEISDYENTLEEIQEIQQKNLGYTESEIQELAKKYRDSGTESQEVQSFIKKIEDAGITERGKGHQLLGSINENKQYYDTWKDLSKAVEDASDELQDYSKWATLIDNTEKKYNATIDNTQSAYKTLTQAASEYNSQGFMNMDTLQSLLALNPKYINCLIDEGGQFSLNRDRLIEYTKAQLLNYEYEQALNAEKTLSAALTGKQGAAEELQKAALSGETDATMDATDALMAKNEAIIDEMRLKVANGELDGSVLKNALAYQNATKKSITAIRGTTAALANNFDLIMGGSSSASKASKKFFEDEFDRYWEFTKAIEGVEHALSELEEQQSHLFGNELISNLSQVNSLLEQQKSNYEALAEAQREEADELRNTLSKYGAEFGEDGGLTNYAAITTSMFDRYGGVEDSEEYEEFKKALERFDTLFYSEMVDTADKAAEASRKVMENNLKIWETDLQINLDLKQAKRDWNDFLHEINSDIKFAIKNIGAEMAHSLAQIDTYNLVDGTIGTDIQKIENINYEINKLKNGGTSQFFASLSEAENALKEANEQLRSDALELKGLYEATWETYLEGMDQAAESLAEINQQYQDINDSLEHQLSMTELLYGSDAYDKMSKIYEAQKQNSLSQLNSLKLQKQFWEEQYQEAVNNDGADSESAKKALEELKAAQKALAEEEQNYAQIVANSYNNAIDSIVENAKKKLQQSKTEWDDIHKQNEGIYDDTERMYQLNTMQNKWNKLISDTSGVKNQQRLAQIMSEQIEYLKDKTDLTEYDIGLAEKELEIAQAQIALEDAQNAKSSMKLTRNAEGNWSYQYVADEDNVADKQQALLDKINDKYEYIKSANQKALEDIMTYEEEYWTRYGEIMKNTSLSDEEKHAQTAKLYETYYGENGILTHAYSQAALTEQQLNATTYEELTALYEADEENYDSMTETEKALVDDFRNGTIQSQEDIVAAGKACNDESLEYWSSTAKDMSDKWNADDGDSIKSQVQNALDECTGFLNDYNEAVEVGCEAAGEDFRDVEGAVDDISNAIDDLSDTTTNYIDDAISQLDTYRQNLNSAEAAWNAVREAVNHNITTMKEYVIEANKATAAANTLAAAKNAAIGGVPSGNEDEEELPVNYSELGIKSAAVNAYRNDDDEYTQGFTINIGDKSYSGDWNPDDDDDADSRSFGEHIYDEIINKNDELKEKFKDADKDDLIKWLDNKMKGAMSNQGHVTKFATGGYTGEWGDEGKIAMLHEKELVLNADDTKNILGVVSFVRDLASSIGTSLFGKLADIVSGANHIAAANPSNTITNESSNTTSNIYNITAEFPNANNVDDIREAILSLPNLVSQKVNEKNI